MKIRLAGPLDEVTGYGELARQISLSLAELGVDLHLQTQSWGCTRIELPLEIKYKLEKFKKAKFKTPDGQLFVSVPLFFRSQEKIPAIGLTMSEVDGLPPLWVEYCNKVDLVLVPSRFNYQTFTESGVKEEKLRVFPLCIDQQHFKPDGPKLALKGAEGLFTFLSIGEWVARKGFDLLIKAFVREFSSFDDVCLILKCHCTGSDYDPTGKLIQRNIDKLVSAEKKKKPPRIFLIPNTIPGPEMASLYRMSHCFVLSSRGEGWNMPIFEAMACGIPVIATNWSAYLDYLNDENAYLITVETLEHIPPSGNRIDEVYRGHRWALPSIDHLQQLMREVYDNYDQALKKGLRGKLLVDTQLKRESCGKRIIHYFTELAPKK